jgi:hypothetical protein
MTPLPRILIVTRLSVPYTGMIVTCREVGSRDRLWLRITDDAAANRDQGYSDFASETSGKDASSLCFPQVRWKSDRALARRDHHVVLQAGYAAAHWRLLMDASNGKRANLRSTGADVPRVFG